MYCAGKLKQSLKALSLLILFSSQPLMADFKQFVPNQKGMKDLKDTDLESDPAYSPNRDTDFLKDARPTSSSGHLKGERPKEFDFENVERGEGALPLGVIDTDQGYLEFKKSDLLRKNNLKGETSYSFSFIKDDFSYDDGQGTFETIYTEPSGVSRGGYLMFSRDSYYYRGAVDLFWRGGFGVGLSYGQGTFSDGSKADANFRFWKIPADLGFGLALPLGNLISLNIAAGGSAIGIWENRSDVNKSNEKRNRRQMSLGYFSEAKLKINLSTFFEDASFSLFREFDVTNFYLDLNVRQHEYNGFKEENLSISGQSVGLGFSFEFL